MLDDVVDDDFSPDEDFSVADAVFSVEPPPDCSDDPGPLALAAAVVAVEAGALEHHADGVEDLAQLAAAHGALGERVVGEALELLEEVAALGAGVLVGRHPVLRRLGQDVPELVEGRLALSAFECQSYRARHNVRVTSASDPDRDRFRDWPTPARYTVYGVAGVVLLLVLALIAGAIVVRRPLPQTTGDLRLKGLDDTVQVRRDGLGVPQIYAGTSHDLFYAQGFVQAQDRFWQMDYRRHLSAGRLSELFGARTLSSDMAARTLGWYRTAEREYQLVSAGAREALESYSDGVNAWLSSHSGSGASLEYTVLSVAVNYRPEPWTPVDSLAWLKSMAWDLAGNVDDEIARARLSVDRDPAQIAELYPSYPYAERAPIVDTRRPARQAARPAALPPQRITRAMLRPLERVARSTRAIPRAVGSGDGLGSNGWVVAGSHTTTGKPLLANDPHLDVGQPGVFYQMGLHCRTVDDSCPYDVAGFSWAGFPGIAIGHNARHRLGDDEPPRRHHRPLPGEGHRQGLPVRRPPAPAGGTRRTDPDRRR